MPFCAVTRCCITHFHCIKSIFHLDWGVNTNKNLIYLFLFFSSISHQCGKERKDGEEQHRRVLAGTRQTQRYHPGVRDQVLWEGNYTRTINSMRERGLMLIIWIWFISVLVCWCEMHMPLSFYEHVSRWLTSMDLEVRSKCVLEKITFDLRTSFFWHFLDFYLNTTIDQDVKVQIHSIPHLKGPNKQIIWLKGENKSAFTT